MVAICIFALGEKYWGLFPPLFESMKQHLKVPFHVYLFTDQVWMDEIKDAVKDDLTVIPMPPCEWPMPTMMRYHSILGWADDIKGDYIFLHDVDTMYVKDVGEEILSPLTATVRGVYDLRWGLRNPFEPNPDSEAYLMPQKYYAGGLVGGERERFLQLAKRITQQIDKDFKNHYIAIWHEESHLNKLLNTDFIPSKVLDTSYMYPGSMIEYYKVIWGRDWEPHIIEQYKRWKYNEKEAEDVNKVMTEYIPIMKKYLDELK